MNYGQFSRLFVHEKIYDEFVAKSVAMAQARKVCLHTAHHHQRGMPCQFVFPEGSPFSRRLSSRKVWPQAACLCEYNQYVHGAPAGTKMLLFRAAKPTHRRVQQHFTASELSQGVASSGVSLLV
mgnify:CR=1 FL=1